MIISCIVSCALDRRLCWGLWTIYKIVVEFTLTFLWCLFDEFWWLYSIQRTGVVVVTQSDNPQWSTIVDCLRETARRCVTNITDVFVWCDNAPSAFLPTRDEKFRHHVSVHRESFVKSSHSWSYNQWIFQHFYTLNNLWILALHGCFVEWLRPVVALWIYGFVLIFGLDKMLVHVQCVSWMSKHIVFSEGRRQRWNSISIYCEICPRWRCYLRVRTSRKVRLQSASTIRQSILAESQREDPALTTAISLERRPILTFSLTVCIV